VEERAELLSHLHIAVALREGAAGDLGGALGNGVVGVRLERQGRHPDRQVGRELP
jgi:hypothetical protein